MGGNYPDGVTGNELAIAGPDYERESDIPCPLELSIGECGAPTMEVGYHGDRWLVCYLDHITDLEPLEPAPDREYDEARERRLFDDDRVSDE